MSEYDETNRAATQTGALPEDIAQAVRRYVAIQRESAALQEERYRMRDQIAAYMARVGAATLTPDPVHSAFYDSHPPASQRISRLNGQIAPST